MRAFSPSARVMLPARILASFREPLDGRLVSGRSSTLS
nr:MAG TPA: hypothetical protein [Caudoviricetes sp.]